MRIMSHKETNNFRICCTWKKKNLYKLTSGNASSTKIQAIAGKNVALFHNRKLYYNNTIPRTIYGENLCFYMFRNNWLLNVNFFLCQFTMSLPFSTSHVTYISTSHRRIWLPPMDRKAISLKDSSESFSC